MDHECRRVNTHKVIWGISLLTLDLNSMVHKGKGKVVASLRGMCNQVKMIQSLFSSLKQRYRVRHPRLVVVAMTH